MGWATIDQQCVEVGRARGYRGRSFDCDSRGCGAGGVAGGTVSAAIRGRIAGKAHAAIKAGMDHPCILLQEIKASD